ncbi:hypothetical protein [Kitasatospora sp. MAA19]|uniref:hypothetical protein n=1 Tax=Kitasatospora sp. MAA19 TaxID=3035090 RepID=UPI002474AD0B|nr:hypothetical protein [Kitasatospora sp. MAA19]
MRHAIRHCERIPGLLDVVGEDRCPTLKASWSTNAYRTGLALFHAGITARPPDREERVPLPRLSGKPRIDAIFERFLVERALVLRPESMSSTRGGLRRFGLWLDTERPHIESLDQLHRADLVDFMESVHRLHKIKHPDQPLSRAYRAGIISTVAVLFRYAAVAEWDDVPARPLITHADRPRVIERVPRFIPADQLDPLMDRVRALDCPLQRCALLVARWSGARRTEIRKLHLDCLDSYPDGTPRLRLAAGKFYKTELELGRCLRLPQEGPCECELYLTCAKFGTTPQYAPRLRERLCVEQQLIADARDRGWEHEVERHQRTADRLTSLLDDLGEPLDQ